MSRLIELEKGDLLGEIQLNPVSRIDLIKYAGASGDFNPIHTIDKEATKAGLPGIIAHGMWTMGNLSKLFTPYLEEGFIQDYKIRFADMVFLDDVITLKAVVKDIYEDYFQFDVMALKENGKAAIKGQITFKIYK
jgi:acyl dehydratase